MGRGRHLATALRGARRKRQDEVLTRRARARNSKSADERRKAAAERTAARVRLLGGAAHEPHDIVCALVLRDDETLPVWPEGVAKGELDSRTVIRFVAIT